MVWMKIGKKRKGWKRGRRKLFSCVNIGKRFVVSEDIVKKLGDRISVFVDEERGLVGLKRDEEDGYSLLKPNKRAFSYFINRDFGFERGMYPVSWSEDEQMFVGKIRFKEREVV